MSNASDRQRILLGQLRRRAARAAQPHTRMAEQRYVERRGLLVGYENGVPIYVDFRQLWAHMFVLGKSGRGKSFFLLSLAYQLAMAGYSVCFIDMKGDTADLLAHFCARMRKPIDKFVFIDPANQRFSPGINWLQAFGGVRPENLAKTVLSGWKKLGREGPETKVWLEEYGVLSIAPLCAAGLTVAEVAPFVDTNDPSFRNAVLKEVGGDLQDALYRDRWVQLGLLKPHEQALMTGAIRNRATLLRASPSLKAMLGQRETTIPWDRLMNTPGNVVVASLGVSPNLDDESGRAVGCALLHQIMAHAWMRRSVPEAQRNKFVVIIDEASRVADRELARGYDVMRGLGVSFITACQTMQQLLDEDPAVAASIIGNSNILASFSASRADAELMAGELYTGHMDFMRVKHEEFQTKFEPVESQRTVYSNSDSESSSWSEGSSSGFGSAASYGASETLIPDGDGGFFSTSTESNSDGSSFSSGSSSSDGGGYSSSSSQAEIPFYEFNRFMERSSTQFWGKDEQMEMAVGAVKRQGVQHVIVGVCDEAPRSLTTPTITPLRVSDREFEQYTGASAERFGRPTVQVLAEIDARVAGFLKAHTSEPRTNAFSEDDFFNDVASETNNAKPGKDQR